MRRKAHIDYRLGSWRYDSGRARFEGFISIRAITEWLRDGRKAYI